jgi:hypothetical protein
MRLRACMLAIAVVVPLPAFAQTPPAAPPPPPPAEAAPPPPAAPPPVVTPEAAPPAPMAPPPAPAPAPAAAPAGPSPKFTFNGLVDTYWMYLFNPASGASSINPPVGRIFDNSSNSFNLALAKMSMNAALDPVTLQLDIGYGQDAAVVNGVPGSGQLLIEQAYGEIALPGNLTLDFGKFVTTAGAEVIEAKSNWLYSRSFLFGIIPFVHTGVRANLKINDMVTVQASLVNSYGSAFSDPDNNAWKTFGASISLTLNPMVTLIGTTYIGKEATQAAVGSTPGDTTILADVVGAFTVNSQLGLNVNFDYVKAPPATSVADDHQLGVSVMGRYVISDRLNFAARGEFLQNHFGGVSTNVEEGTIMLGIDVGKNFELRPELRGDFSGDQVFAVDPTTMLPTKKNQFTGTLAALTWF